MTFEDVKIFKIQAPYLQISNHRVGLERYKEGLYICSLGVVRIYQEDRLKICSLAFYYNGLEYHYTKRNKIPTDRQIAVMAGKFVKYVISK